MSVFFDPPPERPDPKRLRSGKPDLLERLPLWFGSFAWVVTLVALAVASRARPRRYVLFDTMFGVERTGAWNQGLLDVAAVLLVITLVLVGVGLWANSKRLKREDDQVRLRLIVAGAVSAFGIGVYWVTTE